MKERELFLAALDIEDRVARQAHLKVECGGDAELLARVESLLATHEGQSQFLNTPVVEQIADVSESVASATIVYENGSTHDDDPDATTAYSHGTDPMTKPQDDAEFERALGYLEPSSKPDSLGRLGHYEVLEVIGRGAFGTVLRAFDEKLHRIVAIKVMSPEMAATSPARKRFLREAQASAAIRHEHVVSVYAVEEKPIPYLVMEFIPGETLQQRLDARGPLDVQTVLHLGRQIAEGLAAAHAQELIHRDIKPGNILLETSVHDRVKITDFGLARTADDASVTQSGMIAGTPMYMAPEQASGQKIDQRADLFSFGSVLYQMVSGRPPFRAATTLAVLKRLAEDTPRPIREIIPETPQWLCDIISKLHAKNPDERYQSAREIADVLANCESQLNAHAGLKDFTLIPHTKSPPAKSWNWVAVVVVSLLLGLGLYAVNRPAAQPKVAEKETSKHPTKPSDNYGLTFDGSAYVATPVMVPQEGPFTIEAWVTPSSWEGAKLFSVICNAQNAGVSLELRRLTTLDWGFSVQDQSGYQKALSSRPPEQDRPVHLAGVFDGTNARLFVNGQKMETEPALTLPLKPSSLPLMIGANPQPSGQSPIYFFNGLIDEVRISNVARYTNDFSPANRFDKDEHTLALYHFDEGTGDVLKDSSGNNHHGKIVGAKWVRADGSSISSSDADGWVQLFNGKDLAGWKTTDELPGEWTVKDGILTGSSQQSYLFSERGDFANFHLRVEAKTNGLGDSGIFFRAPFALRHGPKAVFTQPASGYEVDLFNAPIPIGTITEIVKGAPPRSLCVAANNSAYRAGEWFTLELIADGNRFVTKVNGQETVNSQDAAGRYSAGHLAISVFDPRTVVQFRKIEIKELPPPPASVPGPQPHFFAANEWIDVIPLIDPNADKWDMRLTGKNEWRIEQGELVGGGADDKPHKLLLPVDADFFPSFECELDFTRRAGEQGFNLNSPNANGDTPLYFDTLGPRGVCVRHRQTGLIPLSNAPLIETGKRTNVRVEVRRQQVGDRITVWNGDAQVGTWTGDRNELVGINNEGYEHRRRLSLWINGGNEFVFHRIRVRMLDGGNAETLRPVPSAASSTTPSLAIAPFDAAQAKAHQEVWAKHLGVPVEYENSIGMKFRLIPPGEFQMGSTAEEIDAALLEAAEINPDWKDHIRGEAPRHRVVLTQPFYLGVHEVTQAEYQQMTGTNPSHFGPQGPGKDAVVGVDTARFPVELVSWHDAANFCIRLSEKEALPPCYSSDGESTKLREGTGYRLPTEAEWEFACRAGTSTRFSNGNGIENLTKIGWFSDNSTGRSHSVGELPANPLGLHDMHGNVWEWIQDGWNPNFYASINEQNSSNPLSPIDTPSARGARGGNWYVPAMHCRAADRGAFDAKDVYGTVGFRAVLSVDAVKQKLKKTAVTKKESLPATFTNSIGMEFVIVLKGRSWLGGGKDKQGDREVTIPADFFLGKYEVTQEEWTQVMGENPSHFSRTGGGKEALTEVSDADLKRFPVETVSWDECQLFVVKLNEREKETGWMYRLPTATEWEYACRGGPMADRADSAFDFYFAKPTNNPLREQSSFGKNMGLNRTGRIGTHEANGLGIFDMHRNVWEWCDDKKDAADGTSQRAQMGGGWNHIRSRSAAANIEWQLPSHRSNALGLRLARVSSVAPSP